MFPPDAGIARSICTWLWCPGVAGDLSAKTVEVDMRGRAPSIRTLPRKEAGPAIGVPKNLVWPVGGQFVPSSRHRIDQPLHPPSCAGLEFFVGI